MWDQTEGPTTILNHVDDLRNLVGIVEMTGLLKELNLD